MIVLDWSGFATHLNLYLIMNMLNALVQEHYSSEVLGNEVMR